MELPVIIPELVRIVPVIEKYRSELSVSVLPVLTLRNIVCGAPDEIVVSPEIVIV
jgi:hypothetical protein